METETSYKTFMQVFCVVRCSDQIVKTTSLKFGEDEYE